MKMKKESCDLLETLLPDNRLLRFLLFISLDWLFYGLAGVMAGLQPHIPPWGLDLKMGRITPTMG